MADRGTDWSDCPYKPKIDGPHLKLGKDKEAF